MKKLVNRRTGVSLLLVVSAALVGCGQESANSVEGAAPPSGTSSGALSGETIRSAEAAARAAETAAAEVANAVETATAEEQAKKAAERN